MKSSHPKRLNFTDIKQRLTQFFLTFEDPQLEPEQNQIYNRYGKLKYRIMLQKVANQKIKTVQIYLEDIEETLRREEDKPIIEQIKSNVKHYINLFYQIIQKNKPPRNEQINPEDMLRYDLENALEKQRKDNQISIQGTVPEQNQRLPPSMHRKYTVIITHKLRKQNAVHSISQLSSDLIGSLIILSGIVIRTDQVKPRVAVATYVCDICGSQNYLQVVDNSFHPMTQCQSKKCKQNKLSGKITFMPQHSHFIPSQQIKIQQLSSQIKQGNIPRTLKILLSNHNIRKAQPGDVVEMQGVVLPTRKQGYAHQQDLIFEIHFQVFKIVSHKKKYSDMDISEEERAQIQQVRATHKEEDLFSLLANCIAPQIYGLEWIKKSLLLQLAGGVTTITQDRLKIRGQVHIMLVGDPGVAKSQLLKQMSYLAPRGVYTTGKGSSDVGLTAAVKIDPLTRDVSLQAGALVLADMGICCIDEFDKMGQYDQTAIHQIMEQQTVSIAKAGLITTLNARTSILAAANPIYGRYNPQETAQKNINLPAALFSRFDLIFIMLDTADVQKDLSLSKHIGQVHKNSVSPEVSSKFNAKFLRTYISLCKQYQPKISEHLSSILIKNYIQRRKIYSNQVRQGDRYITTRNLLALIRLCQARARLRFSNEITQQDIQQCKQIMQQSMKNVDFQQKKKPVLDDVSSIFRMIKDSCMYNKNNQQKYEDLQIKVVSQGYKEDLLKSTLTHYQNFDLLVWNKITNIITLAENQSYD